MLLKVPKPRYDAASRVGGVVDLVSILLKETSSFVACDLGSIKKDDLLFDMNSSYIFCEDSREIIARVQLGTRSSDFKSTGKKKNGFCISADFELVYKLTIDPPPAEVREFFFESFATINAVFNVWPYWREFHDSMINRLGLPNIPTPLIKFVPEPKDGDAEKGKKVQGRKPQKAIPTKEPLPKKKG